MRLHRKPSPARLGQRCRQHCRGFESGCWSLPTARSRRVPVGCHWSGTTGFDRGGPQGVSRGSARGLFFVAIDRADLGSIRRSAPATVTRCWADVSGHPGGRPEPSIGMGKAAAFTHQPPRFGTAEGVQRRVSREHGRKCLRSYQRLRRRQDRAGQPVRHPELVVRRGQEAGDDQLPDLPAREGRPVLRADLRPGEGLGVRLRQVPRDEVQGDDLRPLRRQGDALAGAPQADGPHRAGRAGRPHLVLQGHAQPPGHAAGHADDQPGADHLLPGLRRRRPRRHPAQGAAAPDRGRVPQGQGAVRRRASRPTWGPRPSASS